MLYLSLYASLLLFQSLSKFYVIAQRKKEFAIAKKEGKPLPPKQKNFALNVKYYNADDMLALLGDRAVGNFLEQGLLFLPLLWIHAVLVDPSQSWTICCIYAAGRASYMVVYPINYMGGGFQGIIALSTGPGYAVLFYLMYQIATKFVYA